MMARYLEWALDGDSYLSPEDPLGYVIIKGDKGKIEERETYLDAFFEGLVKGLESVKEYGAIDVDIVDEPYELHFIASEKGIELQLGNQHATIMDIGCLAEEVQTAVKTLLLALDQACTKLRRDTLRLPLLREYVQHHAP